MDIEELLARAEIHDVLLRYCRGVDRMDMALISGAFHDDAWVQFPERVHVGPADGFVEFLSQNLRRYVRTVHLIGNSLVEFDGPEVAHVETYLQADHQASAAHMWGESYVKLWARYLDRFESRNGKWLIANRTLSVDWMYRYPLEGWFDQHPDASVALRDGSDPCLRPTAGFSGDPLGDEFWPA